MNIVLTLSLAIFIFILFFFLTNYRLERSLYVKSKDRLLNSVGPDETAHYEPSHLDLRCLQKPIIIACGSKKLMRHWYPSLQRETISIRKLLQPFSKILFVKEWVYSTLPRLTFSLKSNVFEK